MKLKEKVFFHKPITTSREFFQSNQGIKCVHYGDVYKNYSGKTIRSSTIINSFSNEVSKEKILYCDSIIVPDVTETISDWGHFTYIKFDGTPYINGTHTIALTSNSALELQYLFRYLSSDLNRRRLQTLLNGSTVFQISIKNFSDFYLERYQTEIQEQRHIVDILGTLDETIENNEHLIQKIEEKVLLEYDRINSFEPLSEIVMSDCFDITIGKTPPRNESHWFTKNSTDVKWLSISDLGKSSVFCFDTSERITPEGISKYNVKVVPKNTVVLSFKLTVGKVAITGCDMATNEAIAHFNSSNHCLLEYLYCYLKRYNFDTLGNTSSIATAVNSKTIKAMHFFIPDDTVLENFHHKTLPLFENIRQLLIENQKLNELKQLYLKKFFG